MIGDPPSIRAFKTSITPENVKFFEDSDRDRMVGLVMHKAITSLISLSFESDILREFFPVSFHAATDEGTPQKISPQDTPTNGLTCQCNQTSLHHNLYRFAFLSEPYYASVGNCKLLSGRGSLFRQWGQREVYNLDYVTE